MAALGSKKINSYYKKILLWYNDINFTVLHGKSQADMGKQNRNAGRKIFTKSGSCVYNVT